MRIVKYPKDSRTEFNTIVHPSDANSIGTCFGGAILQWMDMTASICARRHANSRVNTVKVEHVNFLKPLKVGHVAHLDAFVVRVFHSSMEIHVQLFAEDTYAGTSDLAGTAVFIFAAVDDNMKPTAVNDLEPETVEEKNLWQEAGERRKQK